MRERERERGEGSWAARRAMHPRGS